MRRAVRTPAKRLEPRFYRRNDVVAVARDLLGKVLCTSLDGRMTQAIITETEAYAGVEDRASHAYGGRRTQRTEPMYAPGGIAYVYLCYGIHHLFNVVTAGSDVPHAVLIRAAAPLAGVEHMLARRSRSKADKRLLAGPGSLSQALGIRTELSGTDLTGDVVWIEDHGIRVAANDLVEGPRIGVDYAGDDALRPYRFVAATCPSVPARAG